MILGVKLKNKNGFPNKFDLYFDFQFKHRFLKLIFCELFISSIKKKHTFADQQLIYKQIRLIIFFHYFIN